MAKFNFDGIDAELADAMRDVHDARVAVSEAERDLARATADLVRAEDREDKIRMARVSWPEEEENG